MTYTSIYKKFYLSQVKTTTLILIVNDLLIIHNS